MKKTDLSKAYRVRGEFIEDIKKKSIDFIVETKERIEEADIINALANTLQIRLKQDPQSIKRCLVPALRILDYISDNMQKFNVDPTIYGNITVKVSNLINQIRLL